jgi:DNA phosphorothioation-associated putative methyltransferase
MSNFDWESARQRTAIGRAGLSMPVRQALNDDLFSLNETILDYGSGRGQDVTRLNRLGYVARGWDPHFNAGTPPSPHDIVFMTYVLNVIEHPAEREAVLRDAWRNTQRVLVVTSRLNWERRHVHGDDLADGVLTSRNTFQHLYSNVELRQLVERVTSSQGLTPMPGIAYVFRRDRDRLAFVARSLGASHEWASSSDTASAIAEVIRFAEERGRVPLFDEIPSAVLPQLAKLAPQQIRRLVARSARPEALAAGARRQTLESLLYLGIALFEGQRRLADMPLTVQEDIRQHFDSYREACRRADRLLLKLRDDQYLRDAMRNSPGKLTPTALYVHERAVRHMPVVLRLYEHCGSIAAGRPPGWNILKLHHDKKRVAWSSYPDFDTNPHPTLSWTYGVDMSNLKANMQSYKDRPNRPLLHRKHEFLAADDALAPMFKRLTDAEVRAGLYSDPSRIGLESGWSDELERHGVELRGHRLVKRRATEG